MKTFVCKFKHFNLFTKSLREKIAEIASDYHIVDSQFTPCFSNGKVGNRKGAITQRGSSLEQDADICVMRICEMPPFFTKIRENEVFSEIITTFAPIDKTTKLYENETISLFPRGNVGAGSHSVMGMYQPDCW